MRLLGLPWLLLPLLACSSSSPTEANEGKADAQADVSARDAATPDAEKDAKEAGPVLEPTETLGPLGATPLTDTQTIRLKHPVETARTSVSPETPSVLSEWLAEGYGQTTLGQGEALLPVVPPGAKVPAKGKAPTMLLRFVHLPDTQLADDESPDRYCNFDLPAKVASTDGAFRPQEGDECRILDAAVRTINAINTTLPLSFVLTGGDNADNAQTNEVSWFLQIMDGAESVKCDSGDLSDPVPGPNNDGKDPFKAVGLDIPWWWVTGNHDVNAQGTLPVTDATVATTLGSQSVGTTRNYALPGAPAVRGTVVPDPRRKALHRKDLMELVHADGDGHGVSADVVKTGKAFYSFDVANTPLRFIILDTPAETGSADGVVHQADIDHTIKPLFDQAKADHKWVLIASHHPTDNIGDGSAPGGVQQSDALTEAQWEAFLGGYDNLLFSLVGHQHLHRSRYVAPPGGHAWWELMTSALADWPHQFRVVEVWDDDNGWVRLRAIVADYQTKDDPVAATGRELAVTDQTSGWGLDGYGQDTDRNIELYLPKPE